MRRMEQTVVRENRNNTSSCQKDIYKINKKAESAMSRKYKAAYLWKRDTCVVHAGKTNS